MYFTLFIFQPEKDLIDLGDRWQEKKLPYAPRSCCCCCCCDFYRQQNWCDNSRIIKLMLVFTHPQGTTPCGSWVHIHLKYLTMSLLLFSQVLPSYSFLSKSFPSFSVTNHVFYTYIYLRMNQTTHAGAAAASWKTSKKYKCVSAYNLKRIYC